MRLVSTPPFHCSYHFTIPYYHQQKIPSYYFKKCQITSPQPFLVVDCENTPFFMISLCRYCWLKSPLKLEKWLSLLVDFGQVPPPPPDLDMLESNGLDLLNAKHRQWSKISHRLIVQTNCLCILRSSKG